jgi:threonine/homoserine/homoserine lactone efflux protein
MSSVLAALVDITTLMLQIALTVTGVILAWFIVLYALGIVLLGVHAWLKHKRRQKAFRVYRGSTIDI